MISGRSSCRDLSVVDLYRRSGLVAVLFVSFCGTALGQVSRPAATESVATGSTLDVPKPTRDLAVLRAKIAKAIQDSESDDNDPAQRLYVGHLRFLDSVYSQLMLLEEEGETQPRDGMPREIGIPSSATWSVRSFSELEALRDQRDGLFEATARHRQEVESLQSMLGALRREYSETEQQRRLLKEQLEKAIDPAARMTGMAKLNLLQLRAKITEELIVLRSKQRDKAHRVVVNSGDHLTLLGDAISAAAARVSFTQADYTAQAAQWRPAEASLQAKIASLQRRLSVIEGRLETASANPDSTNAASTSQQLNRLRLAFHQCMTETNDTTAYLLLVRQAWSHRYEIAQGSMDANRLRKAESDCVRFSSLIRDKQSLAKSHGNESIESFLVTNGIEQNEYVSIGNEVRRDWREIVETRNRLLNLGVRQFRRLESEIHRQTNAATITTRLAKLKSAALRLSEHELFAVDDRPISVGKIVKAVFLLLVGILLARFLSRLVGVRLLPRLGVHHAASLAVQTISFYSLALVFGFVTLQTLNIPLTVLTFFGGAAAIAVGFGAQNILNNFMSGLIILGERPIRVGDLIEVDGVMGNVEHIGARSTRLRTGNNHEIIIPNSRFLEQRVTNLTLSSFELRTSVSVGVAYESNPTHVEQLIHQAVVNNDCIAKKPVPIILFREFGDNSLEFEVHFWIHARTVMERLQIESSVRHVINQHFREHGIAIAFPQRDLHVDFASPIELQMPGIENASAKLPTSPLTRRAA